MLRALGQWAARRRVWVVAACALATLAAAWIGHGLFARLGYAVSYDPAAESTRGAALARSQLGEGDPDVVALYSLPPGMAPDDPRFRSALAGALERVAHTPGVARVLGATGPLGQRFIARDRKSTFAVVSLRGTPREKALLLPRLRPLLALQLPSGMARPQLGGLVPSGRALTAMAERSLKRGERIALPLVGIVLVLLFGSVVAALLPLVIGGVSIVLTLAVLALLSRFFAVDAFAVNVVTILGLGVAIDYALFIVSRYREESTVEKAGAVGTAVATAGRAVLFSGVTVAASLSGLLVFHQPFLRSIAIGGMAVTLMAALLALVVLPALLALLGGALERGRVPWVRVRGTRSFWQRVARGVIRRRWVTAGAVTLLLVLLALPFRRIQPSRADVRALPSESEPRIVSDRITRDFEAASLMPDYAIVDVGGDAAGRMGALFDYTQRLAAVPGVSRVESILSFAGARDRDQAEALGDRISMLSPQARKQYGLDAVLHGRYALVRVLSPAPPDSPEAQSQVAALRRIAPPPGGRVLVYGQAAALHDFATGVRARAPWMLALVGVVMFGVLFVAFRSLILPLKAMLFTALSLTASFGACVFVFQEGRFQRLLGYRSLHTTDASLPVVMFAVVFGLSMDYEVLILSRIREAWLRLGRNNEAIVEGLAQTGRLVTGAALVMVLVFSAFMVAPLVFVKALGMGMALAVAIDATLVRMLLLPSAMALLGRLNWWPG